MTIEDNLQAIRREIHKIVTPIVEAKARKEEETNQREAQRRAEAAIANKIYLAHMKEIKKQEQEYLTLKSKIDAVRAEACSGIPKYRIFKRMSLFAELRSQEALARSQFPLGYKSLETKAKEKRKSEAREASRRRQEWHREQRMLENMDPFERYAHEQGYNADEKRQYLEQMEESRRITDEMLERLNKPDRGT